MEAPFGYFLLPLLLLFLFGACMVVGSIWLFLGWWKKVRSIQWLSALPLGIGLFVVGPLLLMSLVLAAGLTVFWFTSDWQPDSHGSSPPATPQRPR
jgi:hypothetical protein